MDIYCGWNVDIQYLGIVCLLWLLDQDASSNNKLLQNLMVSLLITQQMNKLDDGTFRRLCCAQPSLFFQSSCNLFVHDLCGLSSTQVLERLQ